MRRRLVPLAQSLRARSLLPRLSEMIRNDDSARARAELRAHLSSGAMPLEALSRCPGCEADEEPWLLSVVERMGLPHRTVLCGCCGLSYASPRMTPASLQRFYAGLYWRLEQHEKVFVDTPESFARGNAIFNATSAFIPKGGVVVEPGCGTGHNLAPFHRAGYRVFGFDPDARCIAFARDVLHLDARLGGLNEALAAGLRADLLILSHVIEHLPDPPAVLRLTKEALNPAGVLYVEVPGLRNLEDPSYSGDLLSYLQIAHLYNFTRRPLTTMIENAGFNVAMADETARVVARVGSGGSPSARPVGDRVEAQETLRYLQAREMEHLARSPIRLLRRARAMWRAAVSIPRRR
jgi:SAM-dependent methyltransferase